MPDIDFQKIELNLIPKKGDEPVIFYASQYESARPFIAVLKWGDSEFAPGDDCYAEIDIRKNDNNLVVITDDVAIDNNEVSVILPVQALTCIGKNLGQVKIHAADDHLIAALNFILEVQPDPLAGGVNSETAIDNLTTQIESIAEEVIGENYYDKTEVDALLADKADVSDIPDMTQYYTKTQTDTLLNGKADASTTYTKTEVDNALALKANAADLATVATTGDYDDLINKPVLPDMTQYYTKSEVDAIVDNIFPTFTASGAIASFTTALNKHLVSVTAEAGATIIIICGINIYDEESEDGYIYNGNLYPSSSYKRSKNFIPVKEGVTYKFVGCGTDGQINCFDSNKTYISAFGMDNTFLYTMPSGTAYIKFYNPAANFGNISMNYPETETSYHAYEGQTVPVADAPTLITLSGVNNVFTDDGDVTVQYKYMSI